MSFADFSVSEYLTITLLIKSFEINSFSNEYIKQFLLSIT